MLLKVSNNFHLEEFVSKETFDYFGANSLRFIAPEIIEIAQYLRDWFGKPMTINNWINGGKFKWRGFRTPGCGVGAELSSHKRGMAIDFNFGALESEYVFNVIVDPKNKFFSKGITTIEKNTIGWTHISCERWWGQKEIIKI